MGSILAALISHYWSIVATIGTMYHLSMLIRFIARWISQFTKNNFGKLPGPVRRFLNQLVAPVRRFLNQLVVPVRRFLNQLVAPVRRFLNQLVAPVRRFHARWGLKFYQVAIALMISASVITGVVTQSWYVFALGVTAVFLSLKLYGREEKGSPLLKKVMLSAIYWLLVPYLIYVLLTFSR